MCCPALLTCLWKSFRRSRTLFRDRPETVRLHPEILFGIIPEHRSESSRNSVRLAPDSPRFRQDLVDRLTQGGTIHVPPLRDRLQDIPLLVEKFFREVDSTRRHNVDPSSIDSLLQHKWPGNVSELRNVVYATGNRYAEVEHLLPKHFVFQRTTYFEERFYTCFISYSHVDAPFARELYSTLQMRGVSCWLDEKQLRPGDDIYEEVDRGIRQWDKVLLCCSENSLTSWWVDNEIATAFEKEQRMMRERGQKLLPIIPLNLDGYLFSEVCRSGKSAQLRQRMAADFTGWEKNRRMFDLQVERLIDALRTDAADRKTTPPSHV